MAATPVLAGALRAGLGRARELEPVTPGPLGFIHRAVGTLEQRFGFLTILRRHRDPDAARDGDNLIVDHERFAQDLQHAFGDYSRILLPIDPRQQDHELVAPQPRHRIGLASHSRTQSTGDLDEQQVTHVMPIGVIDRFQSIKVDEQHGEFGPIAFHLRQRLIQTIVQQRTVRQIGEYVVVR